MTDAEVFRLKSKIESITQDLADFQKEVFKIYTKKNELILDLAACKERLTELGERKEPVTTISYEISKMLLDLGFENADSWVRKVLPSKYKDPSKVAGGKARHAGEEPASEGPEVPEKPIALMNRDELREYTEKKVKTAKENRRRAQEQLKEADQLVEECEKQGIALDLDKKKDSTSTEKDPHESASHIALERLIEVLQKISNKIYEMPPSPEDDAELVKEIDNMIAFLEPLQDEKYRKSLLAWFHLQLENIAFGKHAAGSRKGTTVLIGSIQKGENPRSEKRKITKEQVGDRYDELLKKACTIIGIPVPEDEAEQEAAFQKAIEKGEANFLVRSLSYDWHETSAEPRIAKRAIQVSPKLSAQA
jgi:hypothetical protein